MKFSPTDLPGVILVEPDVFKDSRGFFLETYHMEKYRSGGIPQVFVQDNQSKSVQATLRGLHAQLSKPQGKLVRVIEGEIFDVAVDARPGAPTFGKWTAAVLSDSNFRQMFIPPGFLHGFCVTSPTVQVEYQCTDFYDPGDEWGVMWNDPDLGIPWPVKEPLLSAKDRSNPSFKESLAKFEVYRKFA